MKSNIYFCVIVIISTFTSLFITKKELEKPFVFEKAIVTDRELILVKNKANNLLDKFVHNQKMLKLETQIIKENIEILKNNKPKTKPNHEFYYQHNQGYYAERHKQPYE